MKILFVCTGNICRSPSAEAFLRHKVSAKGLSNYEIDSAALTSYHIGDPPDPRAIAVGKTYGFDMSGLAARKVKDDDFFHYDLIMAMDQGHFESLIRLCPDEFKHKIVLFHQYVSNTQQDVDDPYYGSIKNFEKMMEILDVALDQLINKHT